MRRFTVQELAVRGAQRAWTHLERFPRVERFLSLATHDELLSPATTSAFLTDLRTLLVPNEWSVMPSVRAEVLEEAEEILANRIEILGLGRIDLGKRIDWRRNPVCGTRSPLEHWSRLSSLDESKTGSKKAIWELNRQQFLCVLAIAYRTTGEGRYVERIADSIDQWIEENPSKKGVNWVSSLELSFRCMSWLWSIALTADHQCWTNERVSRVIHSLIQHGRHIRRYLSTYYSPNTHLTGEALGLLYLGSCLPQTAQVQQWRQSGARILTDQLHVQVSTDGVYFERSTWYQRYTADFYLHFLFLQRSAGIPDSGRITDRIAGLVRFLLWVRRPDGTFPIIGDDDGGVLFGVMPGAAQCWDSTFALADAMLDGKVSKSARASFEIPAMLLTRSHPPSDKSWRGAGCSKQTSRAFPQGGYFVLRSGWDAKDDHMVIDCGPHGILNCGHAHADALAIDLCVGGEKFLVDPGTYTYSKSSTKRNLYRSGQMHSTATIDGFGSSLPADDPFQWKSIATVKSECFHGAADIQFFHGTVDGFGEEEAVRQHHRSVLSVRKDYWILIDSLVGAEKAYELNYSFDAGVQLAKDSDDDSIVAEGKKQKLRVSVPQSHGDWSIEDSRVSTIYGNEVPSLSACYQVPATNDVPTIAVLSRPDTRVDMMQLPSENRALQLRISSPERTDIFQANVFEPCCGIQSNFEFSLIRDVQQSITTSVTLVHGTSIECWGLLLTSADFISWAHLAQHDKHIDISGHFPKSLRVRLSDSGGREVRLNGFRCRADTDGYLKIPTQALMLDSSECLCDRMVSG